MGQRFKPIFDRPENEDAFGGGGHQRSAVALADAIESFKDDNRTIGLEGGWGAGKSTVIQIAERQLNENDDTKTRFKFFTFDLWANNPKHVRRAFLESMIIFCQGSFPENPKTLKKQLKDVQGKKRDITYEKRNAYSWFSIAAILFLIVYPTIVTWLSPIAFGLLENVATVPEPVAEVPAENTQGQGKTQTPTLHPGTITSLVLLGAALLAFVIRVIELFCRQDESKRSWRKAFYDTLSIIERKVDQETVTETIRHEDPTDFEFTQCLQKLLRTVQSENVRLVVVVDNIDRLQADDIPGVWADVRAILSSASNSPAADANTALTLIVPYDRDHIVRAIGESDASNSYVKGDFIRKSFDLTLWVAPPVTSDNEAYFATQLTAATSDPIDDQTVRNLFKIFDTHVRAAEAPPTPRQLIHFINEVGTLANQRADALESSDLTLEAMGAYALLRSDIEANPMALQAGYIVPEAMLAFVPLDKSKLYLQLAALAFNVSTDLAQQVVLRDPIMRALVQGSNEDLKKLSETPGFEANLIEILRQFAEEHRSSQASVIRNCITNLTDLASGEEPRLSTETAQRAFKAILPVAQGLPSAPHEQLKDFHGLFECFAFLNQRGAESIAGHFADWANSCSYNSRDEFAFGNSWIKFVGEMLNALAQAHNPQVAFAVQRQIVVPNGGKLRLGAAYDADVPGRHINQFGGTPYDDLFEAFVESVAQKPDQSHYVWQEIQRFSGFSNTSKRKSVEAIVTHLHGSGGKDDARISTHFSNLAAISSSMRRSTGWHTNMKPLLDRGAIYHYLNQTDIDGDMLADGIWAIMATNGAAALPNVSNNAAIFGNLRPGQQAIQNILQKPTLDGEQLQRIAGYFKLEGQSTWALEQALSGQPNAEIFKQVVRAAVEGKQMNAPLTERFVKIYPELHRQLPDLKDDLLGVVARGTGEDTGPAKLAAKEIDLQLLKDISKRDDRWSETVARIDEELRAFDEAQWTSALSDVQLLSVLAARVDAGQTFTAGTLRPAYAQAVHDLLERAENSALKTNAQVPFFALPSGSRKALAKAVYEQLPTEVESLQVLQRLYEFLPDILAEMPFDKNGDQTVERVLLPLLRMSDVQSADFIRANASQLRRAYGKASAENKELLGNDVNELVEQGSERGQLLAKVLKVAAKASKTRSE